MCSITATFCPGSSFYLSASVIKLLTSEEVSISSVQNKGATELDKEVLHNQEACESGMNVCGLLLCCSSSFQRLDVTKGKKWGQNSVKFILSHSLMAWQKRRYDKRAERRCKKKRNDDR